MLNKGGGFKRGLHVPKASPILSPKLLIFADSMPYAGTTSFLQAIPDVSKGRKSAFRKLMNLRCGMRPHSTAVVWCRSREDRQKLNFSASWMIRGLLPVEMMRPNAPGFMIRPVFGSMLPLEESTALKSLMGLARLTWLNRSKNSARNSESLGALWTGCNGKRHVTIVAYDWRFNSSRSLQAPNENPSGR